MDVILIVVLSLYLLIGLVFDMIYWLGGPRDGRWTARELAAVVGFVMAWLPLIVWAAFTNDYD